MTRKRDELKPCPFCGEKPYPVGQYATGPSNWWTVDCSNCTATITAPSREDAVRRWNHRVAYIIETSLCGN